MAVDHFVGNGRCAVTIKALGYPSREALIYAFRGR
jgi:hypothetical protein